MPFFNDPNAPTLRPQPDRFDAQPNSQPLTPQAPNTGRSYLTPGGGPPVQSGTQDLGNGSSVTRDANGNVTGGSSGPVSPHGPAQPYQGNPTDRNAIRAWFATQTSDPDYWADRAIEKGGINDGGGYWQDLMKSTGANGGAQSSGQAGGAAGALGAGMGGDLLTPYTNMFKAPTGTDDPGFSFALNQGLQGIERGAAARGTLLTGGTVKDELAYATGSALQNYDQAFNRARQTWDTNYGLAKDNQDRPFNKLYQTANMGLNATQDLSNSYDRNTSFYNDATNPTNKVNLGIDQGNINAQDAVNRGNGYSSLVNIGGNLLNSWFNRPRTTATNPNGYSA